MNEALLEAIQLNWIEKINELLTQGADIYGVDTNAQHHSAIAHALIQKNVSVNLSDAAGYTILIWAAKNGYTDIVNTLINKGIYVNARDTQGSTPLMLAAMHGHLATVNALIAHGANVNIKNQKAETALKRAITCNHIAIIEALLRQGASLSIGDVQKIYAARDNAITRVLGSILPKKVCKLISSFDVDPALENIHAFKRKKI